MILDVDALGVLDRVANRMQLLATSTHSRLSSIIVMIAFR